MVRPCSDEKCNLCLQRGASFVINYKSENFVEAVNGLTKVPTSHRALLTVVHMQSTQCVHTAKGAEAWLDMCMHWGYRASRQSHGQPRKSVCCMCQGKGVDVIVDCVGAPYLEKDLECLAMDGKVIFIGWMAGAQPTAPDAASYHHTICCMGTGAPCACWGTAMRAVPTSRCRQCCHVRAVRQMQRAC